MTPDLDRFDILIAGAGLVGAATAALLARSPQGRSLQIGLLEAKPFSGPAPAGEFDPRVVALTEASRLILADIGAWSAIAATRCCPYRLMSVRDSEGTGLVEFDCADLHRPDLGHIVENSIVVRVLLEVIAQLDNVELICPAVVRDIKNTATGDGDGRPGGVRIALDNGESLQTALLVAADGANSRIRDNCRFRLRNWDYGHSAIVATIRTAEHHGFCARQWFMPTGPLAFLPLRSSDGDCHYLSIVWSQQQSEAERLLALDDLQFCQALSRASEHCLGSVLQVSRRFCLPLLQRHAVDYVQPGVALVGDAAHTIHPLAGQGVNLGMQDAKVLVEELCRGLERGLPAGDISVLQRYQRRRKPENLAMMAAMESFKRLFEQRAPALTLLRNAALSRVNRLGAVKTLLVRQAMGI